MIQFICLFLPAIISIVIIQILEKEKLGPMSLGTLYGVFVLLINTLNLFFLTFIFKKVESITDINTFTNAFIFKYLFMSIIIATLLGIISTAIRKNTDISLYIIETNNKKDQNEPKKKKN